MKTLISILTAGFVLAQLFITDANAQARGAFDSEQSPHIGWLYADNVNLTESQKLKIAHIIADNRLEMRAERRTGDRSARGERRIQRTEHRADLSDAIKEILTPEQYAAYQKNVKNAVENRSMAHTYIRVAHARIIADEIGLSEAKKEAVAGLVKQHVSENMDTRGFRQGRTADIDTRIERLETRRDFENKLKEIMTDEEFSAWTTAWSKQSPGWNMQRPDRGQRAIRGDRQRRIQRN